MDRFDEMAVALVNKWLLGNEPAKIADIAAALRAAATVPAGHLRLDTDALMRVTAVTIDDVEGEPLLFHYTCVSAREAAEAAKGST